MTTNRVPKGLDGVVVADTEVGEVRGEEGFFHYRQYSAVDLARACTFEEVVHLLLEGRLPPPEEAGTYGQALADRRGLPPRAAEALAGLVRGTEPLHGLRSAVSMAGAELGWGPTSETPREEVAEQARRLVAIMPTMVAAGHRLRLGLDPLPPRPELGHAANYLWMLRGELPDPALARALEQYLVLTVDHGFNASTFTARVIASTGTDLASSICGALGALAGPLHGGAPSRALDMLDEVRATGDAAGWVARAVERGERVMGFGHRVYRTDDPRAVFLRRVVLGLDTDLAEEAGDVERTVVATLGALKPGRRLYANVEFYAGVVMASCGVPRDLFTPTFAIARSVGWCAHVLEQLAENRLIRPLARYVGPPAPVPLPDGSERSDHAEDSERGEDSEPSGRYATG